MEDRPKDLKLTLLALDYLHARGSSAQCSSGNPAVMLPDLKPPKIDGLEVLQEVRATPALRSVPVVMLTASREEQHLLRSYSLGVNAYVVKPVEFRESVQAIADLGIFWAVLDEPPPGSLRAQAWSCQARDKRVSVSTDKRAWSWPASRPTLCKACSGVSSGCVDRRPGVHCRRIASCFARCAVPVQPQGESS